MDRNEEALRVARILPTRVEPAKLTTPERLRETIVQAVGHVPEAITFIWQQHGRFDRGSLDFVDDKRGLWLDLKAAFPQARLDAWLIDNAPARDSLDKAGKDRSEVRRIKGKMWEAYTPDPTAVAVAVARIDDPRAWRESVTQHPAGLVCFSIGRPPHEDLGFPVFPLDGGPASTAAPLAGWSLDAPEEHAVPTKMARTFAFRKSRPNPPPGANPIEELATEDPDLLRLLVLTSLPPRVFGERLRHIRTTMMPWTDLDLEVRLLETGKRLHFVSESGSPDCWSINRDLRPLLQAMLKSWPDALDAVWSVTEPFRANEGRALEMEENLCHLCLIDPPDRDQRIEEILAPAFVWMDGDDPLVKPEGAAAWWESTLKRLPEVVIQHVNGRALTEKARSVVSGDAPAPR